MNPRSAFRVLGLTPEASDDDIHRAWLDLAQVWHPDRFAHDARLREKAERNLQRINEAYQALQGGGTVKPVNVASRITESFAAILGLGEPGEPPEVPGGPAAESDAEDDAEEAADSAQAPTGPIGARDSLKVLGLGVRRSHARGGEHGRHGRPRLTPMFWLFVVIIPLIIVLLLR